MEMMKEDTVSVTLLVKLWHRGYRTINVDVNLSDTIGKIKEMVCDQVMEKHGMTLAYEAENFHMALSGRSFFIDDDTTKTLAQVLADGNFDSKSCLIIKLYPLGTKLDRPPKDDKKNYYEPHIDDGEEDCVNSDDEIEVNLPEDAFTLKRPEHGKLPKDGGCFRVFGDLLAYRHTDYGVKKRYVPYGGFFYPLESVTKLSTPALLVLLVFNSKNMDMLQKFYSSTEPVIGTSSSQCDDDSAVTRDVLLAIKVGWDNLSYLFLRMLRKHDLGHDLDIVAVTDLDVHHLDLLVFLDTPPRDIPELYGGWDLSEDCARLGIDDTQCVDIKWLGIRPSDAETSSQFRSCFTNPSHQHPDDFSVVNEFLKAHPHVAAKIGWVKELELMSSKKLHRSFPYIADGVHWRMNDDVQKSFTNYLLKKINQQNWI